MGIFDFNCIVGKNVEIKFLSDFPTSHFIPDAAHFNKRFSTENM